MFLCSKNVYVPNWQLWRIFKDSFEAETTDCYSESSDINIYNRSVFDFEVVMYE